MVQTMSEEQRNWMCEVANEYRKLSPLMQSYTETVMRLVEQSPEDESASVKNWFAFLQDQFPDRKLPDALDDDGLLEDLMTCQVMNLI